MELVTILKHNPFKKFSVKLTTYAVAVFVIISAIFIPFYVNVQKEAYINIEKESISSFVDYLLSTTDLTDKDNVKNFIEENNGDGYRIHIFTSDGNIIYTSFRSMKYGNNKNSISYILNSERIDQYSENAEPYYNDIEDEEEIVYRKIAIRNNQKYYIFCKLNLKMLDSIFDYTNENIFLILISYIVICSIALFILLSLSIKPIEKLSRITSKIAQRDFSQKYNGRIRSDEIGVLSKNINEMADTIQSNINSLSNYNFLLKQNLNQVTQYEEMKTRAVRNITHELKTPLAIISSQIEMMHYTNDVEKKKYYYESAMEEITKMSGLITNIVNFTFEEKDIFGDEVKKINVSEEVKSLCKKTEDYIKKHLNRNIETDIEPDCILTLSKNHIEHIFNNYIMNAIQHSKQNTSIKVTLKKCNNAVRLSVYNEGENIEDTYSDLIWKEEFSSLADYSNSKNHNIGLGLYIVKEISLINKTKCGFNNHKNGVEFWYDFVDCKLNNK